MDPRALILTIRTHWLKLAITTFATSSLGIGMALTTPDTFQAEARVFVSVSSAAQPGSSVYSGAQFAMSQVASYAELATTPAVLGRAGKRIGVVIDPSTIHAVPNVDTVIIGIDASAGSPIEAAAKANAVAAEMVTYIPTVETRLID